MPEMRAGLFFSLTLCVLTPLRAADELPGAAKQFITKRCAECHDTETKKGGFDITALPPDFENAETFARWVKIHDRVRAGEMPLAKKEQPTAAERENVLKGLNEVLARADGKRQREQGRVPLRRMNRTEYENTMRDLFSMPGLLVKDLLPEDGRFDGFDKVATALDMSAVQMRKYLEAADYVLDTAIAHQDKPIVWKQRNRRIGGLAQIGESSFPIFKMKADMELIGRIHPPGGGKGMDFGERTVITQQMDSLGIITHARPSYIPEFETFSPYHSGFYRLRMSLWSFEFNKGEILPATRMQSFALTASGRLIAYLDAASLKPQEHEMVVWLNASDDLQLNPANLWGNFNTPFNYEGPGVAVDFVDIEGPLNDSWPPASHRRLFGTLPIAQLAAKRDSSPAGSYPRQPPVPVRRPGARPHHVDGPEFQKWQPVWTAASPRPTEDAERLLNDFLPRAFRRPVPPEEVAVYVKIARDHIAAGDFFETAMRDAFRTALCSPDFLYLQEPQAHPKDPTRIDGHAIASRLSYFIWNSMPDDELIALAEKHQLGGGTLAKQLDRMLDDPKSERFIADFLDQWVELRKIDFTSPDVKLYPEFRPDLRDAMVAETRAFFREMLVKNLGVSHLVNSDFLMINQRLAEHYGIPGVEGSAIRRVPKPAGSPRGGLLTQGAILKLTANGTTTSPVLRGAWVMNRIIGRPLPPPPPDIPAVDPDIRGFTTIRAQLDKHRNTAVCAGCHAKMDPPGFALENFDVIGAWRAQYRFVGEKVDDPSERKGGDPAKAQFLGVGVQQWQHVLNNVRLGLPVDASGTMADGRAFKDICDFKRILLADEETLARNLVQRLILYSTGAPVSFADRAQVDLILQRSREGGYGLRTLIKEIVMNPLFQRK